MAEFPYYYLLVSLVVWASPECPSNGKIYPSIAWDWSMVTNSRGLKSEEDPPNQEPTHPTHTLQTLHNDFPKKKSHVISQDTKK